MKTLTITLFAACLALSSAAQVKTQQDSINDKSEGRTLRNPLNFTIPLFIVNDAEVTQSRLSGINPDSIQSIRVLKDSAALVKYGERGRYGVIIVELKDKKKLHNQILRERN